MQPSLRKKGQESEKKSQNWNVAPQGTFQTKTQTLMQERESVFLHNLKSLSYGNNDEMNRRDANTLKEVHRGSPEARPRTTGHRGCWPKL